MNNRYSNIVVVFVLSAFVVGLAGYNHIAEVIAPLKAEDTQENELVHQCKENPLKGQYRRLEKKYGVDLSFTDCIFYKQGKGPVATFPVFDLPRNSADILVVGDSSVAWGFSTVAASQVSGLDVASFNYEGMLLTRANIPVYEAIANCVLKPEGRVILAFTPTNQSQPGGELTTSLMAGYRKDIQHMLQAIKAGNFCDKYFSPRKQGVIRGIVSQGRILEIIAPDGTAYIHRIPEGLLLENYKLGDKISFRPAPMYGRMQAVSIKVIGEGGDFGKQTGVLVDYDSDKDYGRIKTREGDLYYINAKTLLQSGLSQRIGKEVAFYAYRFRKNAIAYKVFEPGYESFTRTKTVTEKFFQLLHQIVSFNDWQSLLDDSRKVLRDDWGMDLPNIDFYGSRLEKYINPEWHRVKNQYDPATQSKIQWGDDTITIYGSTFSDAAPDKTVENYYLKSSLEHPFKANAESVLEWADRRELIYMLPLSVVPNAKAPRARAVYMQFYQNQLGLIDMHSHFIESKLSPILMQFGHHPANEGGMVQSLEIGKVLREFRKAWQSGEKAPVNTEYKLYKSD